MIGQEYNYKNIEKIDEDIYAVLPNPCNFSILSLTPGVALCIRRPVALRQPYPYTTDLLALEGKHPQIMPPIPPWLAKVVTPLKWEAWEAALREHQDPVFKQYICQGIQRGFRVGFDYMTECHPATRNMPSAQSNPAVVREYLEKELGAQRICGPVQPREAGWVQINRFGVIPKDQPGK